MTPTINTANATETAPAANTPMTRDEVKAMLRDAAFVLRMTARVKAEIVAERPVATKTTSRKTSELPAGLGV